MCEQIWNLLIRVCFEMSKDIWLIVDYDVFCILTAHKRYLIAYETYSAGFEADISLGYGNEAL